VFETSRQVMPWLLAMRSIESVGCAIRRAMTEALRRSFPPDDRVSISPVSEEWLVEHQILASKHENDG
jgi:hypothetical protein